MAIKARKHRGRHDREQSPYAARVEDGSVCVIDRADPETTDARYAVGDFRITKFFDHGDHCGHDHGPPQTFGPFETRQQAIEYAQGQLGADVFRKV
jgi:hypothetical protein